MIEIQTVAPSQDAPALERVAAHLLASGAGSEQPGDQIAEYVSNWAEYEQARVLVAEESSNPVGWLGVVPWPGEYATLHWLRWGLPGWPTVIEAADEVEIGRKLLAAAEETIPSEVRAILCCIDRSIEVSAERLSLLQDRYAQIGYQYAEAVHFIHETKRAALPSAPEGLRVVPLREPSSEELIACIRDVFSGDVAEFFCGGSVEEQEAFLRGLPKSSTMDEAASVALLEGSELVGFATAIGNRDNENLVLNWLGLRPAWRRRGYARFLLQHTLAVAGDDGYRTASLSSHTQNAASMALYENEGWDIEGAEHQFTKYVG